jgi:Holliday junction resolvasome RuvABC ATP-dependent DNA helicase subunit
MAKCVVRASPIDNRIPPELGVDGQGLTDLDRRYLKTVIQFYHGGGGH